MDFMLITCGLSLITNYINENRYLFNDKIYKYSNLKEDEIDSVIKIKIDKILENINNNLVLANIEYIKKNSAELNTFHTYYTQIPKQLEIYLLVTDTYLSKKIAEIYSDYFKQRYNLNVNILSTYGLNTKSLTDFKQSSASMIKELYDIVKSYKDNHYKIIFNLSGGFKSVNSLLNVFATLYADETLFIFESSDDLLIIPKLPIITNPNLINSNNINVFRSIEIKGGINDIKDLPDILFFKIDSEKQYILSEYGELIWNDIKYNYYSNNMIESLSGGFIYSDNFKKQFNNLTKKEKYMINKTLDDFDRFLFNNKINLRSLRFHSLSNGQFECYPFDGNDSRRLYCSKVDNKFIIEKLDKHL